MITPGTFYNNDSFGHLIRTTWEQGSQRQRWPQGWSNTSTSATWQTLNEYKHGMLQPKRHLAGPSRLVLLQQGTWAAGHRPRALPGSPDRGSHLRSHCLEARPGSTLLSRSWKRSTRGRIWKSRSCDKVGKRWSSNSQTICINKTNRSIQGSQGI